MRSSPSQISSAIVVATRSQPLPSSAVHSPLAPLAASADWSRFPDGMITAEFALVAHQQFLQATDCESQAMQFIMPVLPCKPPVHGLCGHTTPSAAAASTLEPSHGAHLRLQPWSLPMAHISDSCLLPPVSADRFDPCSPLAIECLAAVVLSGSLSIQA